MTGCPVHCRLVSRLTLFVISFFLIPTASSSSSSSISLAGETTVNVRDLDNYGNAVQLEHAAAAANQQGRLLVALVVPNFQQQQSYNKDIDLVEDYEVWVLTPRLSRANRRHRHVRETTSSSSSSRLLHPLHLYNYNDENDNEVPLSSSSSGTFVACTGVQGDALWLIRQLQRYSTVAIWERYHTVLGSSSHGGTSSLGLDHVAWAVAELLRRFLWDDAASFKEQCYQGPAWKIFQKMSGDEDDWSRPLGVRVLVVVVDGVNVAVPCDEGERDGNHRHRVQRRNLPQLCIIEPSGIVSTRIVPEDYLGVGGKPKKEEDDNHYSLPLVCLGRRSEEMYRLLQEKIQFRPPPTERPTQNDDDQASSSGWEEYLLQQIVPIMASLIPEPEADELQLEILASSPQPASYQRIRGMHYERRIPLRTTTLRPPFAPQR